MSKGMLLYGKNSVYERLKINPSTVKTLFLEEGVSSARIEEMALRHGIAIERLSAKKIENMKRAKNVQGVLARVDDYKYPSFNELLDLPASSRRQLVFLDQLNDPQNLGMIIRILACSGSFAAVIPKSGACGVTEAVLHVASGGENYVPVVRVKDAADALTAAKKKGYWMIGGMVDPKAERLPDVKLRFPLCLVLGAEAKGISSQVQELLDLKVYIPMPGAGLSMNVSMACTVFCYEITRQNRG